MKKTFSILLAALMLMGVMAACAPAAAPEASPTGDATPAVEATPATAEPKPLPEIKYIFNTNAGHQQIAELLQAYWGELGFNVTIENQEWAVFQTSRTEGNYMVSRHGWLGDYIDPMTFLDLFLSYSAQNDPNYKNEEFDALIKTAKASNDVAVRMQAMHDAEKLLVESFAVLPIYYYTDLRLNNHKVTGATHDALINHLNFKWASKADGTPINYQLGATPKSLDPALNNATDGASVIQQCFDGLTRRDKDGKIVPAVAESWDISADGLTWTFHLRDTKWSDGKPVTAQNFEFAMKRAVNPLTGAEYAYQMEYIKGASEIIAGTAAPETLGVKAIDDKTLEIVLAGPCAYFTEMVAFPTYYPVREDIVANEGWANKAETYIVNGAYKITSYTAQDKMVLEKNDQYWDAANVLCPKVINWLTDDDAAALAAFETGEIDICETFPSEETDRMKTAGFFEIDSSLGVYYASVNMEDPAMQDPAIRKALALAIDRQDVIDVVKNNAQPAYAFVPGGFVDADGGDFRTNGGNYFGSGDPVADMAEAKQILKDAGYIVP